jgi:hypothetical protein
MADPRVIYEKNWWEEFQPASPAPVIKSVVVEYWDHKHAEEVGPLGGGCASLRRGDSFFQAFPHAQKLSFATEVREAFFDQPANTLANIREMHFRHPSGWHITQESVFPHLGRFNNLEVLTLEDDMGGECLEMLPQNYVLHSLRTLNIMGTGNLFELDNVWEAIPRQFPRLRTLRCGSSELLFNAPPANPRFLNSVEQLKHFENLELTNCRVPLDGVLEKVLSMLQKRPATIRCVVCQSSWPDGEVVPTDKVQELRQLPGYRVEFQPTNPERSSRMNGYYFAISKLSGG